MICRRCLHVSHRLSSAIESTDLLIAYRNGIARKELLPDEQQLRVIYQLRDLHARLHEYTPDPSLLRFFQTANAPDGPVPDISKLSRSQEKALVRMLSSEEEIANMPTPKGFMLTGAPGTGKSLILDLFFRSLPTARKFRRHYDHFLLSLYHKSFQHLERQRILLNQHETQMNQLSERDPSRGYPWSRRDEAKAQAISKGWRTVFAGGRSLSDPSLKKEFVLACIAKDLIQEEGWLLAFDEVQLVDVAGASILRRVLEYFWRFGGVVCGTSNRVPDDLYQYGMQRQQFLNFIALLENRCPVVPLDSPTDWRRRSRSNSEAPSDISQPAWYLEEERGAFEEQVKALTGGVQGQPTQLPVYGRQVTIPWTTSTGIARISFADLCTTALGPADYLSIAAKFPTLILDAIPILPLSVKNEARRFITLIDALYESRVRLICCAAAKQDDLFFPDALNGGDGDSLEEEALSETLMEPYRPNVSVYSEELQEPSTEEVPHPASTRRVDAADERHPSADVPAFKNLAIFSGAWRSSLSNTSVSTSAGQDERFAFRRAVSRLHEMTSVEYWAAAQHAPLSSRPWEERFVPPPLPPNTTPLPETPPHQEEATSDAPRFNPSHFFGFAPFSVRRGSKQARKLAEASKLKP